MRATRPRSEEKRSPPRKGRDWTTLAILVLLALSGLIPWAGVVAGDPPAYTAELGAAVTIAASIGLVITLLERRDGDDS